MPHLLTHSYTDMVTARKMAIACGYEDADDLDTLRHDSALKIACDRAPETRPGLPSPQVHAAPAHPAKPMP